MKSSEIETTSKQAATRVAMLAAARLNKIISGNATFSDLEPEFTALILNEFSALAEDDVEAAFKALRAIAPSNATLHIHSYPDGSYEVDNSERRGRGTSLDEALSAAMEGE